MHEKSSRVTQGLAEVLRVDVSDAAKILDDLIQFDSLYMVLQKGSVYFSLEKPKSRDERAAERTDRQEDDRLQEHEKRAATIVLWMY